MRSINRTLLTCTAQLSLAVVLTAVPALGADDSPLTHLVFQRSLQSGVRDANGNLITGTEIDFLAPHQGRLFASNCLWLETDPAVPKACHILVLDSPKGQWRIERQFTGSLRCSVLKEITFSTDGRGQAIAPVSLLLTAPDVRSGPVEVFCRDDATGQWSASVLGTATRATNTRSLGLHRDKVTGIDRIFAGNRPLGVVSGVYDPAAPGRIRWDKAAEVQAPAGERVMGFCDCNGILYAATSRHIYQRTDGVAPKWKDIYFCEKEVPSVGIRGLTAVPKPGGKGEVLWFAASRKVRRLDPAADFKETNELDMPVFLMEKLGVKTTFALSAYNELMSFTMPGTGEKLGIFGFACSHPAAVVNSHPSIKARAQMKENAQVLASGNGRYVIRHAKGADLTYEVAEITDPREPQLVATRSIVVSPFPEDQSRVLYFAGYDCNSVPSHNTAWIYRGELPRATQPK
jgi:hypothetical protein